MPVDRSTTAYLLLHYVLLLVAIFALVVGLELVGVDVSLWLGLGLAVAVGILYPRAVRSLGIAPEHWEP